MSTWSTPMELELESSVFGIELQIGDEVRLEYAMKGVAYRDLYFVKAATPNNHGGCASVTYRLRLRDREAES